MRSINFTIPEEFDNTTLLSFLRAGAGVSLHLIRSLKRVENGIQRNGEHIRTIDTVYKNDVITLNLPDDSKAPIPSDYPLEIIYEDDDILVANKPACLPMHESHNHQGDTLANAVAGHLQRQGKSSTFRAIGRLDKGTSGVVVCALNSHAAAKLSGKIKKQYLAIPTKGFSSDGTIDKPIYRPDPIKTYRTADDRGDKAVTHYHVEEYGKNYSLLRIDLETGRTHQIRVHFSYLGAPLYGDTMYGTAHSIIPHQALHCENISFTHPVTNKMLALKAEMPPEMKQLLEILRKENDLTM